MESGRWRRSRGAYVLGPIPSAARYHTGINYQSHELQAQLNIHASKLRGDSRQRELYHPIT